MLAYSGKSTSDKKSSVGLNLARRLYTTLSLIDGRETRPRLYTPTASSFVSFHDRLVHASIARGIIAIGNTEADGVRMFYAIGNVDQIKRALVELALEDKGNDEESFNYGTEDISDF